MSTRLIRRCGPLCGILFLSLFTLMVREARADTDVTVNDTRDLLDPSPNFGPDCKSTSDTCTLRAAIQRANHQFGTHTIRLPAGTFTISRAGRNEDAAESGDFDIKGNIVILGAGAKNTIIDGAGLDRVFDVINGSLFLQSLTVRGGAPQTTTSREGGGIRASAPLTVNRVHLHSNFATFGGGIFADNDLSIVRSTIANNLYSAVEVDAQQGLSTRHISIRDSTFSGNGQLGQSQAAIVLRGKYSADILHTTIGHNFESGIEARTLFRNADLLINQTILGNNGSFNCDVISADVALTDSLNVDSDGSCGFSGQFNPLILVDPVLGPLQDNGGQTPTHVFNNPALRDAGTRFGPNCSETDQRGLPRPIDLGGTGVAECDLGAIELQGPAGIAVLDPDNAFVKKRTPFSLRYLWRVPFGETWHDLNTLDLRIVDPRKDTGANRGTDDDIIFWVRWSEAANTFQLINPETGYPRGSAFPPGSNHVLETQDVQLDLRNSSSEGSGPTGQEVTLRLALSFDKKSKKDEHFNIEVTALDDSLRTQPFLALGTVAVDPSRAR